MKYAYMNGIILDGKKDMIPQREKIILVEDEKIVDIVEDACLDTYKIIDLKGQYILPGLINLHVHLIDDGCPKDISFNAKELVEKIKKDEDSEKEYKENCMKHLKTQLYSGVTTIRTVGGVDVYHSEFRDKIQNNEMIGPRILTSNMGISVPEGHCVGYLAYEAKSEDDMVQYVEKLHNEKVDLIKLMVTGGVLDATKWGEPGIVRMNASYIKAACDKAHELGYKVAAHVESKEGLRISLQNGVDTIEHGAYTDDEIITLFKEKKAALVTTLSVGVPFVLQDKGIENRSIIEHNGIVVFEGMVECAKECIKNNIMVGLGNDAGCPYVTHYDFYRELYYFQKYCDVTSSYALHCATLQNAKIAGIDAMTGSIEKGKYADFIVCKENPLEDLRELKELSMVVSKGNIHHPVIERSEKVERLLG